MGEVNRLSHVEHIKLQELLRSRREIEEEAREEEARGNREGYEECWAELDKINEQIARLRSKV